MAKQTIEAFVRANDNAVAYSDSAVDQIYNAALDEIDSLLTDAQERDVELWDEVGVDGEATVDDYEQSDQRDLDWVEGLASVAAASMLQTFLSHADALIVKPLAYRAQMLDSFALSRDQLIAAGKRGGIAMLDDMRYAALQRKYISEFSALRGLSNVELYNVLREADALVPFDQLVADNVAYVTRMTSYKPGSPQFTAEVSRLIDTNAKGGLQRANRHAVQRLNTQREAGGDDNAVLVWIVEGGTGVCAYCGLNAGVVKTYRQWVVEGQPGAEVCAGGLKCRCQLMAV